jgi:hypothetical protein
MKNMTLFKIILWISLAVLSLTLLALIFDEYLASNIDVIGIRIAMLIVAFASFGSSTLFSVLILYHNKTVVSINQDLNTRAELFRELQFSSSNYSVIEFMDRMIIFVESTRYIDRYIKEESFLFHMIEKSLTSAEILNKPDDYYYFTVKIPYKVVEGKLISKVMLKEVYFERGDTRFFFMPEKGNLESRAYLLFNEKTKRHNVIMNLIVSKTSAFFDPSSINSFSKFKMHLSITSLLGVRIEGMSELYFTNPEKIEGDASNTYKINSSNFVIKGMPFIESKKMNDSTF